MFWDAGSSQLKLNDEAYAELDLPTLIMCLYELELVAFIPRHLCL